MITHADGLYREIIGKRYSNMTAKELLDKIQRELDSSTSTRYMCEDGTEIHTDVGYVEEWFRKYVQILE